MRGLIRKSFKLGFFPKYASVSIVFILRNSMETLRVCIKFETVFTKGLGIFPSACKEQFLDYIF